MVFIHSQHLQCQFATSDQKAEAKFPLTHQTLKISLQLFQITSQLNLTEKSQIESIKVARKIAQANSIKEHILDEFVPGNSFSSDDELLEVARNHSQSIYHPVGTCKMGHDKESVVDDQLRVHGVKNLRVVDASIMPELVSGNTNAPTMMIAEKAAEMILETIVIRV